MQGKTCRRINITVFGFFLQPAHERSNEASCKTAEIKDTRKVTKISWREADHTSHIQSSSVRGSFINHHRTMNHKVIRCLQYSMFGILIAQHQHAHEAFPTA